MKLFIIAAAVGIACFILGMVVMSILDSRTILDQKRYISKLKAELTQSKKNTEFYKNTREVKFVELAGYNNPANNVKFGG